MIFMAPNSCIPRTLDPAATFVAIPANYFSAGVNYLGLLQFGLNFHNSTDVPLTSGYGAVQRTTSFPLQVAGGTGPDPGPAAPARFTGYRVVDDRWPEFTLSGTAGKSYTIQRAASLIHPAWGSLGSVTMNASGEAVYRDVDAALASPAYYRAMSQ